jgi:hypothetical protein
VVGSNRASASNVFQQAKIPLWGAAARRRLGSAGLMADDRSAQAVAPPNRPATKPVTFQALLRSPLLQFKMLHETDSAFALAVVLRDTGRVAALCAHEAPILHL